MNVIFLLLTSNLIIKFLQTTCADLSNEEYSCKFDENYKINMYHKCDTIPDCPDGSDENVEMCQTYICHDQFKCASGQCIPRIWACDGFAHCVDGSDESPSTCQKRTCRITEFKCNSGKCISRQSVCNKEIDCLTDYEDENLQSCKQRCMVTEDKCKSGQCILKKHFCDGIRHCADNTDENEDVCNKLTCIHGEDKCADGRCIEFDLKCKIKHDCYGDEYEQTCGKKHRSRFARSTNENVEKWRQRRHPLRHLKATPTSDDSDRRGLWNYLLDLLTVIGLWF